MNVKKEISIIIILLALTVIYIIGTLKLTSPPLDDGDPTLSFYPWLLILIMIPSCIYQIISLKKQLKPGQENSEIKIFTKPALLGISVFAIFIFAFNYLGYWTAAIILTFGITSIFEAKNENKKKKWTYIIILTILIPIVGYLFYGTIFNIHFPKGILF